jgi:hypothetical protein
MNNPIEENIPLDERLKKQARESHPSSRKSRSISRYFLGNKRASIDITTQDVDISRCLTSVGIFDSYDLWTNVTLFRDYSTCRRLFIITKKNQLIIGKSNQKQSLLKIKHQIDLNRIWLYTNINDSIASEITTLTYYEPHRTFLKDLWSERIQSYVLENCFLITKTTDLVDLLHNLNFRVKCMNVLH